MDENGDKKTPCRGRRHGSGLALFVYRILFVAIRRFLDTIFRRVTIRLSRRKQDNVQGRAWLLILVAYWVVDVDF